jgi:hypothetical protein
VIPALCEEVILHVDDDQRGGALLRPSAVAKTNIVIQDMHHHIIDVQCQRRHDYRLIPAV